MNSLIARHLPRFHPVVLLRSDQKPENALQLEPGLQGACMMGLFARAAAEGATAVFDRDTCGCAGALVAFGFGNAYLTWTGGADTYAALFAKGLDDAVDKKAYRAQTEPMPDYARHKFMKGERLHSSREKAYRWITKGLPIYDLPEKYAIFKPLSQLRPDERALSVIFTVNPLELSALLTLAGSIDEETGLTVTPQGSGCQMFGNFVFREAESEKPKAVLGLTDLAVRPYVRKYIPMEYLTYSVPWSLFTALEKAAEDGVFEAGIWQEAVSGVVREQ